MRTLTRLASLCVFCLVSWRMADAQIALALATLDYPPYIVSVDSMPRGPIVDIVTEAFRRAGQRVDIRFYPWSRALGMVQSGQIDGLFTIKKNPEREDILLYPKETLLSQDYVFFIRKDSGFSFSGDFTSIAQARIGVVRNTSYGNRFDEAVKRNAFSNLETASDYQHIFRMLIADRVDAVICSRLVGLSHIRMLQAENLVSVSGPPAETAESYLVFTRQKEYGPLAEAFSKALADMKKDGTLNRLLAPIR